MIKEIFEPTLKQNITKHIIEALPNWFGRPESNLEYINDVKDMLMFAYYENEQPIGFLSLNPHHESTIEIHVMGILKEHHRKGIGQLLVDYASRYAKAKHYKLLEVKTLDASHPDSYYKMTRNFYLSVGFIPVETFKELWGKDSPCLLLVKPL